MREVYPEGRRDAIVGELYPEPYALYQKLSRDELVKSMHPISGSCWNTGLRVRLPRKGPHLHD